MSITETYIYQTKNAAHHFSRSNNKPKGITKITLKTNGSRDSPGENYFNPIFGKIPFLYPLKMSENQRLSDVSRRYRNGALG